MIPSVMAALEAGDLTQAEALLQQLPPEQLPVQLCQAWLAEKKADLDGAENRYRELLRQECGPKITLRARQGLERIAKIRQQKRAHALATVTQAPDADERGVLILEAVSNSEVKGELARHLARIMQMEPYAARMLLPSRGWRYFRTGLLAELAVYGQELQASGIPAFWVGLEPIDQIQVLEVRYLEQLSPRAQACWGGASGQVAQEVFEFDWADVAQRVEGLLPIYETVVDRDARGKTVYKEQVQDHAQCCDLHLPKRKTILRFYRGNYQFNRGIDLSSQVASSVAADQETSWAHWRQLMGVFNHYCPNAKVWNEFTAFAETVLDQVELLKNITPHLDLFRRDECYWDHAFQLYSGITFQLAKT